MHLELLQLQLLVWTSGKYERVLVDNPTLDTTAALSGTDASFEGLLERLGNTMDFLLQAVETLRIRPILRGAAEAALRQVCACCDPVLVVTGAAVAPTGISLRSVHAVSCGARMPLGRHV